MKRFFAVCCAAAVLVSAENCVYSCSRVLSSNNGQAVLFGRTFDWPEQFGNTDLYVLPRGITRDGGVEGNSLKWKSKYASLVAATYAFDNAGGSSDGINEKGLGANMLWLEKSDYGKRDNNLPGLSIMMWAQYFLDNFATVNEAVKSLNKKPFQVVPIAMKLGEEMYLSTLHLSLEDRSGDSAILEYVGGKLTVHHSRKYTVMTNEPPFEEQLANLKQYEGFGGTKPIPGSILPQDRFVRASYYMKYLPKPRDMRQALAHVFSVMANTAQPFSVSLDPAHPNNFPTIWTTVGDLKDNAYFFESCESPNIIWARLDGLDVKEGAPVMKLDVVNNPDRYGDVTGQFVKSEPFAFVTSAMLDELAKKQK